LSTIEARRAPAPPQAHERRQAKEAAVDGRIEYPLINSTELAGEAWAAMSRQDPDEALRLWQAFREHSPERPEGYIWPIQVLWESGRLDEAEAVAAEAVERFPDDPELSVQLAWIANARQRWDLAAERWAAVRSRLPERPEGYVWGASALSQCGRTDEADKVAAEGMARFPEDIQALVEHAWTATTRQEWEEALRRWMRVNETDPERLDGQVRTIQALRMVGRIDDSEAMTAAAFARHPDNIELLIEHVWAAVARRDWSAAATRLDRARGRKEDLPRIESSLGAVEHQIRSLAAANARAAFGADGVSDEEISPNALMLAFESIGERCDFGSVQRHFGADPLGLLRFAWSHLDPLVAALEDRFDVVGTVEDTAFELFRDETILRMKKYGLIFHTFVEGVAREPDDKREAFYQQQRRRLTFLKNKLIADLEEPQKICVYSTDDYVSDANATRLFRALRAYGPNSLLYVRPARAGRPAGTVEVLEDGLYAGYFSGLTDFLSGNQPPFELWQQLCLQTHRLAKPNPGSNDFQNISI
jgi:Flp pilus assembly protein TadD